jgi:hypothetical protein
MKQQTALIATLPKSGTWYSHNFFLCYEQMLRHAGDYLQGRYKPDLLNALKNKTINTPSSHQAALDIKKLFICHTVCPGFSETKDVRSGQWEALYFPLFYNWGEELIREHKSWNLLNPAHNPQARIVYLYRNPLDHFVSFYNHAQHHVNENHRRKLMLDGTQAPIESMHDFVFNAGVLGAFIKHYYSFRQMHLHYPQQILLMPYEQLTQQPRDAFTKILTFLGAPPDTPVKKCLFDYTLDMCSKDSILAIEAKLKRSIVGDQIGEAKHVQDGEIGKWQKHFSKTELEKIESVFERFDITLKDFNLGGNLPIDAVEPLQKQVHQIAFFEQQLAWTGIEISALKHRLKKSEKHILPILKRTRFRMIIRTIRPFMKTLHSKLNLHIRKRVLA